MRGWHCTVPTYLYQKLLKNIFKSTAKKSIKPLPLLKRQATPQRLSQSQTILIFHLSHIAVLCRPQIKKIQNEIEKLKELGSQRGQAMRGDTQLFGKETTKEKIAAGRKEFWADPVNRENYAKRISERNLRNWKNPAYREKMRVMLSEANFENYKMLNRELYERLRTKIYGYGRATLWETGINKYYKSWVYAAAFKASLQNVIRLV